MNITDMQVCRTGSFPAKLIIARILTGAVGLIAGLALFFPREILWQHLISNMFQNFESIASVEYDLSESGWKRAGISSLELFDGKHKYVVPSVGIKLGFRPLVQAVVNTGPEMIIQLESGKRLSFSGEIDPAILFPDQNAAGIVRIDGRAVFKSWDQPPYKGEIELISMGSFSLDDSMEIDSLVLKAVLRDNRLELNSLQAEGPVKFACSGHVLPDWDDPAMSIYHVQGSFSTAGDSFPFERQGRLGEILP